MAMNICEGHNLFHPAWEKVVKIGPGQILEHPDNNAPHNSTGDRIEASQNYGRRIRNSGDLTKALAAGADMVMIGSMLAGTEESPGASVVRDGRRYKIVRGMASLSANIERRTIDKGEELDAGEWERVIPEGVEAVVPYRGAAADILYQLVGGLRSGMSYAGASNIVELRQNAEFIRISLAGMRESGAHDVEQI